MILLDGERLFPVVSGIVQHLSQGSVEAIPEMIVVGIENVQRNRDLLPSYTMMSDSLVYGGSSLAFLDFITQELIPEIQQQYRVADYQLLVGHSFGGLFAVNELVNSQRFDAYLALDPSLWWEEEIVDKKYQASYSTYDTLSLSLYIAQANNPFNRGLKAGRLGRSIQQFKRSLDANTPASMRYRVAFFEDEDHFSIPAIGTYHGLKYLFEGYTYPLHRLTQSKPEDLETHYQSFTQISNGEILPPGKLLNQIGMFLLNSENETSLALSVLELNLTYYPGSYIPYMSLGNVYLRTGDTTQALQHFHRALEISPQNPQIEDILHSIPQP